MGMRSLPTRAGAGLQWVGSSMPPTLRRPPFVGQRAHTATFNVAAISEPEFDEARLLGVLCAVLAALSAVAIASRGDGAAPPPFMILREVLAGGLAAAIGETVFFPLEVIKIRLQAAHSTSQQGSHAAKNGLVAELRKLLDGASLLAWAATPGVVAGVLRAVVYHGLRLGLFPPVKRALSALLAAYQGPDATLSLGAKIFIGVVCGGLGSALCNPLDLAKARLAADPKRHANSLACVTHIARDEGGPLALWRGGGATTVRAACGSGAQLATYDAIKRKAAALVAAHWPAATLPALAGLRAWLPILVATIASAAAYVTAAAPADLVKTRLMLSGRTGQAPGAASYDGPLDCLRKSVRAEGFGVLFCGWGASFARLLPVLLLVIPLLEILRGIFGVGPF